MSTVLFILLLFITSSSSSSYYSSYMRNGNKLLTYNRFMLSSSRNLLP